MFHTVKCASIGGWIDQQSHMKIHLCKHKN